MEMVHKITLGSGKVVLIRELQLRHQELAMKAVGNRAGDNQFLFANLMQKELIKLLIVQIDGKTLPSSELEDLNSLFSMQEYLQVSKVIQKLIGDDAMGEPQTEIVSFGGK